MPVPGRFFRRLPGLVLAGSALLSLASCLDIRPMPLAVVTAQPKTSAQRNLTPFYPALQCMDDLFVKAKRPRMRISSNQIPDRTKRISVDARSMIITALNHMTRRSKAFQFVEQGIHARTSGDTLVLEKDTQKEYKPPLPTLYFSGSISQVDTNAQRSSLELVLDTSDGGDYGLVSAETPSSLANSIVTLDLHLVSFPSRLVVPGSAVSNSMVVSQKAWRSGFVGTISQRTIGLEMEVQSIESQGQAVRSLIELGLIEMLGSYTGVPFWTCLSQTNINANQIAKEERAHGETITPARLQQAQSTLALLGYTQVRSTGTLDRATRAALARFQAREGLLPNGTLDFDTARALEQVRNTFVSKPVLAPSRPAARAATSVPARPRGTAVPPPTRGDDGFKSLGSFVDDPS